GGCSGLSYSLEFDSEIGPHDKEFEIDGIKVVVDKKSYLYLNGTTLDYVQQGLTGGFTFQNPSAKSSCGCGTSFSASPGRSNHRHRARQRARSHFDGASGRACAPWRTARASGVPCGPRSSARSCA